MRRRYSLYNRRRKRRAAMLILVLLLSTVFLVSCMAGNSRLWVLEVLGWDVENYVSEPTEQTLTPTCNVASELSELVNLLVTDNVSLQPFQGASQAVELYRDTILNDLLRNNYTVYTGNKSLLATAQTAYPHTILSTLIPASDFENAVYRYFGGTSVTHQNGDAFTYLVRAKSYTSAVQIRDCRTSVTVIDVEETENTYRMRFTLSDEKQTSDVYTGIFVKREDGSCYWKALLQ